MDYVKCYNKKHENLVIWQARDNLIVRIMAILDRRIGKRRLKTIGETIEEQDLVFREFYAIRVEAENRNDER